MIHVIIIKNQIEIIMIIIIIINNSNNKDQPILPEYHYKLVQIIYSLGPLHFCMDVFPNISNLLDKSKTFCMSIHSRTKSGDFCRALAILCSALFCYVMFYSILFYRILFYYISFYSTVFYSILFHSILFYSYSYSYSILFYSILFYSILLYSISFYYILLCSVLLCYVLFCFYTIKFCSVLFCGCHIPPLTTQFQASSFFIYFREDSMSYPFINQSVSGKLIFHLFPRRLNVISLH